MLKIHYTFTAVYMNQYIKTKIFNKSNFKSKVTASGQSRSLARNIDTDHITSPIVSRSTYNGHIRFSGLF